MQEGTRASHNVFECKCLCETRCMCPCLPAYLLICIRSAHGCGCLFMHLIGIAGFHLVVVVDMFGVVCVIVVLLKPVGMCKNECHPAVVPDTHVCGT